LGSYKIKSLKKVTYLGATDDIAGWFQKNLYRKTQNKKIALDKNT
jgi:hypothetical protein